MRDEINQIFEPLCVDIEIASIAYVCYVNHIPFIVIRFISDTTEHRGVDEFDKNCIKVSEISMQEVTSML